MTKALTRLPAGGMPSRRRSLRFVIVGGINTLFGFAIYPALLLLMGASHYLPALAIAQVVSLVFAFTLHKLVVFRSRGRLMAEFLRFSSFYAGVYAVNWAVLPFLVEVGRVPPIAAQLGFAFIVLVGSYFWHSRLTFRPSPDQPEGPF